MSPIRHTASFFRTRAMEENSISDGSTMVSAPLPTTSSVSSGAMNAGGVLVQPDPDGERVVGQRGEQPAQPVALAEVLVDDDPVGEAEPGSEGHVPGPGRGALLAEGDHVLGQKRRPGRGAGHVHPLRVSPPERLGHLGPADHGAEPELVAAGEEHPVHLVQHVQPFLPLAVVPVWQSGSACACLTPRSRKSCS